MENDIEKMTEADLRNAQLAILLPRWNGKKFVVWPHVPFMEVRDDGCLVAGYRPLDVKYTVVIE